jgi:hypothetical protein
MDNSTKIGVVTGTGAALNVSLGFIPDYVRIVAEDGSANTEWFEGMAEGSAVRATNGALAAVAAPNGIATFVGSNVPKGFTIGAGTSQAGKKLFYFAARTSSGV